MQCMYYFSFISTKYLAQNELVKYLLFFILHQFYYKDNLLQIQLAMSEYIIRCINSTELAVFKHNFQTNLNLGTYLTVMLTVCCKVVNHFCVLFLRFTSLF